MNLVGLRSSLADARHQRALNLVARDFVPGWEVEVARLEKELTELSNNRSYSAFRASYLNDVRENFIASGHSPSSQAYVPVRPAFKNYWRSESPGMVLNERLAILSVFQRAESNPLITGEQRNQLVSLILSQGDYMKGAKSARDWLDKEFPLPPLISVGDLSPRAPR